MGGFVFLSDSFRHPAEFAARAFDLSQCLLLLPAIHVWQGFGQSTAGAAQDGYRHFQIAIQSHRGRPGGRRLALRFQKQFRLSQNAFADHPRAVSPGGIELSGLPGVAMVLDESRGHALAVVHVDSRHRRQILHGQLRAQCSLTHLLLDALRQQLDQRQAPRYPTHAAVESPRQGFQRVAKALLHLRQQPSLFECAFLGTEAQRPVQQQSFGFAHRPDGSFNGVPAQLLQRRDALVAVDHQVTAGLVWAGNHHDRCLLAGLSQRCQQAPLPLRLADSQVFPASV